MSHAKFHAGDKVIVLKIGTVATVEEVVCVQSVGGPPLVIGYRLSSDVSGIFVADADIEFIEGGASRHAFDDYLASKKRPAAHGL